MAFRPPASPQEQSPCSLGEQGQALLWTQGITHHVSHWWVCTPGQCAELLGELLALIPGGATMLRHSLALRGPDQQRQQQGSTPQDPHGFLPVGFVLHRALWIPAHFPWLRACSSLSCASLFTESLSCFLLFSSPCLGVSF